MTVPLHNVRTRRIATLVGVLATAVVLPIAVPQASADEGDRAPTAPTTAERTSTPRNAGTAWTTPTRPDPCTDAQADSGDVSGCLLEGPGGTNAERGLGEPPFPERQKGALLPWKTLRVGAEGPMVTAVQAALASRGHAVSADGEFGPMTRAAVVAFQREEGLRRSGAVDRTTADALGVERRELGAFPPAGWNWLGWGYNGSPALADWERTMVPSRAVPGFSAGRIRANPVVVGLFEGFMTEITALGYDIDVIGSYVFRCTSGTGKTCDGRTRTSLSNHAYGTALDMNTAQNPEVVYSARDGLSACAVPMRTDMPRSLIRAAEKWGLYWGGYGWYGGCSSPKEWKSSTHRDPMHFEFRGDALIAQAIIAHNSGKPVPRRWCGEVLTIENGRANGWTEACSNNTSPPVDAALVVPVGPSDASAAAISATASGTPGSVIQVASCSGALRWRTLLTTDATPTSVGTLVPLHEGRMCLRVPAGVTVKITRTAVWTDGTGLGLEAISPLRQVDPATDGTITVDTGGEAAWVSAEPTETTRLAARRCSSATSPSRKVTWFAGTDVDELQVVPLTTVDGAQRWCLQQAGVAVTHVARFVSETGAGLTTSVRRVTPTRPVAVPDTTRAVVAQVHARRGDVTLGVCSSGAVVASQVVSASAQVSTVLIPVPLTETTGLSVCVSGASPAQAHLVGHFSDAAPARMVVVGPRTVAAIPA